MRKGNDTPLQIQKGQKPTVPTGSAGSRKNGRMEKTAPDKQNRPENQHKRAGPSANLDARSNGQKFERQRIAKHTTVI